MSLHIKRQSYSKVIWESHWFILHWLNTPLKIKSFHPQTKNSKISIFPPFCRFLEQITAKLFVWSSSWLYNILDLINHSDLASKNVGGKSDQGDRTQVKEKFLKKIFS